MKRRVTSHDVAKKAGVSRSLVSAVLNNTPGIGVSEDKRIAILQAIEELDYRVDAQARGMKSGKSHCIAAYGNTSNPLFLQVLEGMQEQCAEQGYHLLLYAQRDPDNDRRELLDLYLQRRVDGIVTMDGARALDPEWEEELIGRRIPRVTIDGISPGSRTAAVVADYAGSVVTALAHMRQRTGLPVTFVQIGLQPEGWGDVRRRETYEREARRYGFASEIVALEDTPWEESRDFWLKLLESRNKPCAFLSNWSRGAVRLYRAAYELGYAIGRDVHIMALDNTERVNEHLVPPLAAMEVPYRAMGQTAVSLLIDEMEAATSGDTAVKQVCECTLEARSSVGESHGG